MKLAIKCKKENILKIAKIFKIKIIPNPKENDIFIYVNDDNKKLVYSDQIEYINGEIIIQGYCDRFCGSCNVCKEENKYKYDKVTDDVAIMRELKLKRILY